MAFFLASLYYPSDHLLPVFFLLQIDISIQVIQSDGGLLSVAINAVTLALIDAGIPMKDFVVACAAAYVEGSRFAVSWPILSPPFFLFVLFFFDNFVDENRRS